MGPGLPKVGMQIKASPFLLNVYHFLSLPFHFFILLFLLCSSLLFFILSFFPSLSLLYFFLFISTTGFFKLYVFLE